MDSAAWTFEGDAAAAAACLDEARRRADAVRLLRDTLGISQMVRAFDLAGGEQVYVVDLEHTRAVHIVAPTGGTLASTDVVAPELRYLGPGVPDYVCGAVTVPVIDAVSIPDPGGGPPTQVERLRGVTQTALGRARVPQETAAIKLAVPEHGTFAPLDSALEELRYSQHRSLKPGLYTGAMRRVVQLLLGIGDQQQETYERRWAEETGAAVGRWVEDDGEDEPAASAESAFGLYRQDRPVRVQVLYDYRSHRTHGIGWGTDGRAYVIEIGGRGVLVWPLALDPISQTDAGAARYRELYPELFADTPTEPALFPLLGGFPVGAPPPQTPQDLERKVRAGEIVRALDADGMARYSGASAFSTALGWAFHPGARAEAHATCWRYRATDGVKMGYHYAVGWTIGAYAEPEPSARAEELAVALEDLADWERRKVGRLTDVQCEVLLALVGDAETLRDAFDEMQAATPFVATATLREQRSGALYYPAKSIPKDCWRFSPQPQIKFYEPMLNAMVSFDFWAESPAAPLPQCDTPLFVCWGATGVLSVLSYWWRDQPAAPGEPESTREPCQFDGSWVETVPANAARVYGHFYSTDYDPRQELTGGGSRTVTTGTRCGTTDFMSFPVYFGTCCAIVKEFWYSFRAQAHRAGGHSLEIAAAIPAGDRSLYYLAEIETETGVVDSESVSAPAVVGLGDETIHAVIADWLVHWNGSGCYHMDGGPVSCLLRETARTRAESCFEGAPELPYYSTCGEPKQVKYSARFGTPPSGPNWSRATPEEVRIRYAVRLFGDAAIAGETVAGRTVAGSVDPDTGRPLDFYSTTMSPWWFVPSPNACDEWAPPLQACVNRWGSDLIGFEPQFDANVEHRGAPESMYVGLQSCYVGWVSRDES